MEGVSLKGRAVSFAFAIGAMAFILGLLATRDQDARMVTNAIVAAVILGVMSWAAAESALSGIAASVDAAIGRIGEAADGDLANPVPADVAQNLPALAQGLDGMFRQVRANLESVQALAMFDPITSLANRTQFRREAEQALADLGPGDAAALLFIDLDHFKLVNDSYGHAYGDKLLAMVANRLRNVVGVGAAGATTLIGRLAGDEFTVMLPRANSRAAVDDMAQRVVAALSEPFGIAGHMIDVGASVGVAMRPDAGSTLTELMRAADIAMYHAKSRGRGQHEFYAASLGDQIESRTRLEHDVRDGLDRGEFIPYVQPLVTLRSGAVDAVELMLRWHRDGDVRAAADILGVIEDNGLHREIGNRIVTGAARAIAAFNADRRPHRVVCSLSTRQLSRADFFTHLRTTFAEHGATLDKLEIAVSESAVSGLGDSVLADLHALRREGTHITIDNFGADAITLSHLRELPVDHVRLDSQLICGIVHDSGARAIVQAMLGMIVGLGKLAVANGVETADQLAVLKAMGCGVVQGDAVAPQMRDAAYRDWVNPLAPRTKARRKTA